MTRDERIDSIDKSMSDYAEHGSEAALENVIVQAAILLAITRGEAIEL